MPEGAGEMDTRMVEMPKPSLANTDVIRNWLLPRTPFTREIGTQCLSCGDGRAELLLPFRDDLVQHHGYLHGGIIVAMMDNVACWAAASVAGDVLTADMHTNFLSPGKGERFLATAEVVKANRRIVVVRSDVHAEQGERRTLIATGLITLVPTSTAADAPSA